MNILLFGPPSAGKGTQAEKIESHFGLKHISTGDIFRYHIKNETELGLKVKDYLKDGLLVPDELTTDLVATALVDGFLLDGFPRTIAQAKGLDKILQERNLKIDGVILLRVPEDELLERILGRRICRDCGTAYHLSYKPPQQEGICDLCGGELYQRVDDTEETYKNRLEVYKQQTRPILDYYKDRRIVYPINGFGTTEEVSARIFDTLEDLQ